MVQSEQPRSQIRVLIPEGSSLSAREAIAALGPLGYFLVVCDPNPLCVGRFSRFTRNFYRSPIMSANPETYLAFILKLLQHERIDVLLPVHENALLFSRAFSHISTYSDCAVTDFAAFERMQSKAGFTQLLDELNLPHPPTRLVTDRVVIETQHAYPFYIKTAYGTAGFGTWRIKNEAERSRVVQELENSRLFNQATPILIQEVVPGSLEVVQSVFNHGRLVAAHCYRQTAVGVGGSAAARIGIERPLVIGHLVKLGKALSWHGSLMLDYLFDERTGKVAYIDPNPRMGETMNATLNGINLADLIVRLSMGEALPPMEENKVPLESHILISMLLGTAIQKGTRLAILNELLAAIFKSGRYKHSQEDFSILSSDFPSLIPVMIVLLRLLVNPQNHHKIASESVRNYALTQSAVEQIRFVALG